MKTLEGENRHRGSKEARRCGGLKEGPLVFQGHSFQIEQVRVHWSSAEFRMNWEAGVRGGRKIKGTDVCILTGQQSKDPKGEKIRVPKRLVVENNGK